MPPWQVGWGLSSLLSITTSAETSVGVWGSPSTLGEEARAPSPFIAVGLNFGIFGPSPHPVQK